MSIHSFSVIQRIPIPVEEAWDFFTRPSNLHFVIPPSYQLGILSKLDDRPMYEGQIVDYTVRPLFYIRMHWQSLITRVEKGVLFIDEQKRGPYRYWQHQHFFKPIPGGTEMSDIVNYELPGWFLGDLISNLLIKDDLKELFDYRRSKIIERFGKYQAPVPQSQIISEPSSSN